MKRRSAKAITSKDVFLLTSSCLCSLGIGVLLGGIAMKQSGPTVFTVEPDTRKQATTVHVEAIRNGMLVGKVAGDIRIFAGAKSAVVSSGSFKVPAGPLLQHEITVQVPDGALYMASRRGRKYYSVTAASGQRIAPQNRVYFGSRSEAEAAGYTASK